jgi:glycosyltransferase involved in cell wall biosynthesis
MLIRSDARTSDTALQSEGEQINHSLLIPETHDPHRPDQPAAFGSEVGVGEPNTVGSRQVVSAGRAPFIRIRKRQGTVRSLLRSCMNSFAVCQNMVTGPVGARVHDAHAMLDDDDIRSKLLCYPIERSAPDAHRLLYIDELCPEGGGLDFLAAAIAWAEAHPGDMINITWLGAGDLRGVFQAQPMPANLNQCFGSLPGSNDLANILRQCGILIVPSLSDRWSRWMMDAMASGLPVLGSVRSSQVRSLVVPNESGWLFDPLRGEIFAALTRARATPTDDLDSMRIAARNRVKAAYTRPAAAHADRILTTMRTGFADGVSA